MNEIVKRSPGRPRQSKPEAEPVAPAQLKMKAKPNWENYNPEEDAETPDRYRIDPSLVPEGMSLQWVTDTVYGQPMAQHRQRFERTGWTPVHQEDFDGQFNGMFMPKNALGEINVDGMVLMARPKELTDRAKLMEKRRAHEQVAIKEAELRGGNIEGVTLDAQHPTALNTNRITKSMERITVPKD